MKDVVNTDFMKDLVGELGLDMGEDGIDGIVANTDAANNAGEEEKKDEEKKDGNSGTDGGAAK